MIIIISKDKDFSHTLAEQVVRELEMPCECIQHVDETKEMDVSAINIVVSDEELTLENIPILRVVAPIRIREILARIEQLSQKSALQSLKLMNDMTLSLRSKTLSTGKKTIDLTDKETRLLQALAEAGTQGISKDELLKKVWGFEADLNTHTLETHIYRLRAKCKELTDSEMITANDKGYVLEL